ncbi:MAG: response regulator transcription factor, partial [Candidatus Neomarinimicrobiota bacterium]
MKQTTILIADDHTILRQGLRILINSEPGLRCIGEAGSGEEAVALAREHTPDVVIMDISMEGLNGIDATRIIKNEHPDIKVVILSMFPDDEYVLGAVDAGASGYLVKQTAANNLIDAIRAVSNDQVYFSPAVSKVMVEAYRQQTASSGSSEA